MQTVLRRLLQLTIVAGVALLLMPAIIGYKLRQDLKETLGTEFTNEQYEINGGWFTSIVKINVPAHYLAERLNLSEDALPKELQYTVELKHGPILANSELLYLQARGLLKSAQLHIYTNADLKFTDQPQAIYLHSATKQQKFAGVININKKAQTIETNIEGEQFSYQLPKATLNAEMFHFKSMFKNKQEYGYQLQADKFYGVTRAGVDYAVEQISFAQNEQPEQQTALKLSFAHATLDEDKYDSAVLDVKTKSIDYKKISRLIQEVVSNPQKWQQTLKEITQALPEIHIQSAFMTEQGKFVLSSDLSIGAEFSRSQMSFNTMLMALRTLSINIEMTAPRPWYKQVLLQNKEQTQVFSNRVRQSLDEIFSYLENRAEKQLGDDVYVNLRVSNGQVMLNDYPLLPLILLIAGEAMLK